MASTITTLAQNAMVDLAAGNFSLAFLLFGAMSLFSLCYALAALLPSYKATIFEIYTAVTAFLILSFLVETYILDPLLVDVSDFCSLFPRDLLGALHDAVLDAGQNIFLNLLDACIFLPGMWCISTVTFIYQSIISIFTLPLDAYVAVAYTLAFLAILHFIKHLPRTSFGLPIKLRYKFYAGSSFTLLWVIYLFMNDWSFSTIVGPFCDLFLDKDAYCTPWLLAGATPASGCALRGWYAVRVHPILFVQIPALLAILSGIGTLFFTGYFVYLGLEAQINHQVVQREIEAAMRAWEWEEGRKKAMEEDKREREARHRQKG